MVRRVRAGRVQTRFVDTGLPGSPVPHPWAASTHTARRRSFLSAETGFGTLEPSVLRVIKIHCNLSFGLKSALPGRMNPLPRRPLSSSEFWYRGRLRGALLFGSLSGAFRPTLHMAALDTPQVAPGDPHTLWAVNAAVIRRRPSWSHGSPWRPRNAVHRARLLRGRP